MIFELYKLSVFNWLLQYARQWSEFSDTGLSTADKVIGSQSSVSFRKTAGVHFHLVKKKKEIDKVSREHVVLFRLTTREGLGGGHTEAFEVDGPRKAARPYLSAEEGTGVGDSWSVRETVKPGSRTQCEEKKQREEAYQGL